MVQIIISNFCPRSNDKKNNKYRQYVVDISIYNIGEYGQ